MQFTHLSNAPDLYWSVLIIQGIQAHFVICISLAHCLLAACFFPQGYGFEVEKLYEVLLEIR